MQLPAYFDEQDESFGLAARAAAAAGAIIRDGYQQVHEISQKEVGDLVSRIDFEADKAACAILGTPDDKLLIVSEELNPDQYQPSDDMWIVDPLDGTTAYLMGGGPGIPSVLIAKQISGKIVLGIVYFPLTDEWFYAVRGRGAYRNGKRLLMDNESLDLTSCWVEMNQYGNVLFETDFFAAARRALRSSKGARIVTSGFPSAGVAMRIAEQASGLKVAIHDNCPESVKQGPWDIAATQLIFEEAGGVFVNPELERISPFRAEPIIVAPSIQLAARIVELSSSFAAL